MTTKYDDNYNWIKVPKFSVAESLAPELKYHVLWDHHIEETTFLVAEVRSLALLLKESEKFLEGCPEAQKLLSEIKKKINS
jgi:hypothetical protein